MQFMEQLALTEITLGNLLHLARVPFRGHLLAMNQALILCRATREKNEFWRALELSAGAAWVKLISCNSKKITPALALCIQGFLFSLGRTAGGFAGCYALLLWPTLQRFASLGLLFALLGSPSAHKLAYGSSLALLIITAPLAFLVNAASRSDYEPFSALRRSMPKLPKRRAFYFSYALALSVHFLCSLWDGSSLLAASLATGGFALALLTASYFQKRVLSWLKNTDAVPRVLKRLSQDHLSEFSRDSEALDSDRRTPAYQTCDRSSGFVSAPAPSVQSADPR